MALVNKCQQRGKQHSRGARSLFRAFVHVGSVFGRGKNIFGFRVFNYTYWALVRVPGRVWWGGLQRMRLDDAFPIGKVLPFRDAWIARGSGLLLGTVFQGKKCILVASMYLHLFQSFPGIRGSRNGEMG